MDYRRAGIREKLELIWSVIILGSAAGDEDGVGYRHARTEEAKLVQELDRGAVIPIAQEPQFLRSLGGVNSDQATQLVTPSPRFTKKVPRTRLDPAG